MNTPVRPFDLPLPPGTRSLVPLGLVESPSPAIGPVLFATSSIDPTGYSVLEDDLRVSVFGRAAFASFLGLLAGVFVGVPLAFGIGALLNLVLPSSVMQTLPVAPFLLPALLPAAIAFRMTFRRTGRGKQTGTCVYVGAEGVEKITYEKGQTSRLTIRYDAVTSVARNDLRMIWKNSGSIHNSEGIILHDATSNTIFTHTGGYISAGNVGDGSGSPEVVCVREIVRRATEPLDARIRATLRRGEPVTFEISDGPIGTPKTKRVVLQGDQVEYHDDAATPPLHHRFHQSQVAARQQQGQFELVPSDPSIAGLSFARLRVKNVDILVRLLREA